MKQYVATVLNLTAVYNLSSVKFGHGDIIMVCIFSGNHHRRRHPATTGASVISITRFLVSDVRCAISCD